MEISTFQQLMQSLYRANDSQRGIHRTALWLGEEVGELMRELKKTHEAMDHAAIAGEMADIYAWVASLANLLDIDLDQAVVSKYANVCPRCTQNPCECHHNLP